MLFLSDNMITEITRQTFSGLTLIQDLSLSGNRIQSIESGTFARMRLLANL
jgi:Leucine-rich repeat (LRR) protein